MHRQSKKLYIAGAFLYVAFCLDLQCLAVEYQYDYDRYDNGYVIVNSDTTISGTLSIPSNIRGYPVTSLGDKAFQNCIYLTEVIIPDSVHRIGNRAFYNCHAIKEIFIPNSVTNIGLGAFENCTNLTHIVIPEGVDQIYSSAFHNCSSLTNVTLSSSLTKIANNAFNGCCKLQNISLPDSLISIGDNAFSGCNQLQGMKLSDSLKEIGENAFSECESITDIIVPNTVTNIGQGAFYNCISATNLALSTALTRIRTGAFNNCRKLKCVEIPDKVYGIDDSAFYWCNNLERISIPPSVTYIGASAFFASGIKEIHIKDIAAWCRVRFYRSNNYYPFDGNSTAEKLRKLYIDNMEITSLEIPEGVDSISGCAFRGFPGLKSVSIPNSVSNIGYMAFMGCAGLSKIKIPEGVETIEGWAFNGCTGIKEATFPSSLMNIKFEAFENCSSLESIAIPSSVTNIGAAAFRNCVALSEIKMNARIENVDSSVFNGCTNLTLILGATCEDIGLAHADTTIETKAAIAPTREEDGWTAEISCSRCGEVIQESEPIHIPRVRNVIAKQRYPWNGLVDVTCEVSGISGATNNYEFSVAAINSGNIHDISQYWVVENGTNAIDYVIHTNGIYHLVWESRTIFDNQICSNMVIRVNLLEIHEKVQLWENGPYWATTNIGAEHPEEYGYYFWWGDTIGYKRENNAWVATDGTSSNIRFYDDVISKQTYDKDISALKREGWIVLTNGTDILAPEHDAARMQWGGKWRMPTESELSDLNSNCDWEWTTQNDVVGYIVRGRDAFIGNSIFLPASGFGHGNSLFDAGEYGVYWSSVPADSDNYSSWYLIFYYFSWHSNDHHTFYSHRSCGNPVRPVQGFSE